MCYTYLLSIRFITINNYFYFKNFKLNFIATMCYSKIYYLNLLVKQFYLIFFKNLKI